jgi:hypothetical protein
MKSFQELREKTLTPAEKKKREEIAQAIERDNPGMDMSKKMAIATAQAKKVAEEVDEAVKARPTDAALHKTLGPTKNYQQGVEALKKAHGFTSAQAKGHVNRLMSQIAKADKTQKEEVEQVAELDDKTVKSYHQKAMKDTMLGKKDRNVGMSKALNRMSGLGKPLMKGPNEETVAEAHYKMVDGKKMRWDDMKKMWMPVQARGFAEQTEEQIDELKTSTLRSYISKGMKDKKKIPQRMKGQSRALDRLTGRQMVKVKPGEKAPPFATRKFKSYKAEQADKTPPFEGPYKKVKSVVPGKQGEGPSTAKHLAKMGLKKFMAKDEKK